ncbi:MAG TPA: hypothetical protein VLA09_01660 [Longimicrobiales bacterium]|nr:hypothetical protein [Longimicrobiales bacterium]
MPRSPSGRTGSFLAELKRRKVYRATVVYLVLSVAGLELASALLPSTTLPEWFDELFLGLAIVGLPLVLVLAWTFDVTETGIERTPKAAVAEPKEETHATDRSTESEPGSLKPRADPEESATDDEAPTGEGTSASVMELDPLAVAVLPFENLSGSESAEPFALGLHDDLLTELSRASALLVISRSSVKAYRGSVKSTREIARELGAGTIVEGGVQQAGNRVRLNVQVIDARSDAHLWAERYDRELTADNIFELQAELAGRIMAELHAKLTPEEQAAGSDPPTGDLEAYRLYATGRNVSVDRSEEGFRAASVLYEHAIRRDPGYALAWAGLADSLVGMADYGHVIEDEAGEMLRRGQEACHRALALDPSRPEAHSAFGRLQTALRNAPGAAAAHARAVELSPNYAGGYQWACWANLLLDEGERAVDNGAKATRLDPLDPEASGNLAAAWLMVGEAERALGETRRILAHHPAFQWAVWVEGLALQALGRWPEGAEAHARLGDRWTRGWRIVSSVLATPEPKPNEAREQVNRLLDDGVPFKAAILQAACGDLDDAFASIRRSWPLPWDETLYVYVHRARPFDLMRSDFRFETLIADVVESWKHPSTPARQA